ncbi:LacI family DNA-binding transcriptional regulator [Streptomyces sp. MST-110588]|uniref:LacI family DNA-binding transcriptional regulator n=1 Tax=Streptomyces sp. MST-110588 TaxID=2833628 RepID=UPI001F5D8624|nr:LacI family DNA-binding transcriptional regulator [Streptomyces sp. MST-110588]UNO43286.1 LacI family DNA-binding transcriptional regulator [Streptomyces sp. MST-110588]
MTTNRRSRPSRPATIPDVAREAGVSRSTASRALADYGSVSPAARERVRAAAEKLGYRANQLARSMITGRTHTLGAVIADIQNPFFAGVTRGITDAARAAGYQVLLANTDEDPAAERAAVKMLRDKHVDGLIVAPASTTDTGHLAAVHAAGCPVVLLDRDAPGLRTDSVTIDNRGAARDAVRRLLAAGHRRIALVGLVGDEDSDLDAPGDGLGGNGNSGSGGDDTDSTGDAHGATADGAPTATTAPTAPIDRGSTGLERIEGYRLALRAAGIEDTGTYLRKGAFHRQDPADLTAGLLALPEPPTAVLATDSLIALGVLSAARDRGLRVPEDLSVVTFDDTDWARALRPRLSVVAQPVQELGATAVRALISRIEGSTHEPEHTTLPTEFIDRESIAPPPPA